MMHRDWEIQAIRRNRERRDKALDRLTKVFLVLILITVFVSVAVACGDVEQVETVTIEGNAL